MAETFVTVAGKPTITKDPGATLDYTFDFTDWLAVVSDTIASVTFPATVGVSVLGSGIVAGTKVAVWVTGGAAGTTGSCTARIVTVGGRTDDRTIYFKLKER
jgi:hypothetical protein